MTGQGSAARDISYAHGAASRGGRAVIRVLENATGRLRLIRRAAGYDRDVAQGQGFFAVMAARYGLRLELAAGGLDLVPRDQPVVMIANHPYGILDGLMLGRILEETRGSQFRILANSVFVKAPELSQVVLPIRFDDSRAAVACNLETRARALAHLREGGAVGVFPGGTVSTGVTPFAPPMDPGWRGFTARMLARSEAVVVPVFFDGHTSRLFQIASHVHPSLRLGLLIREFRARVDRPVRVVIGAPIGRDILDPMAGDTRVMMDFLRKATYDLSPIPLKSLDYGYEFEERHRA